MRPPSALRYAGRFAVAEIVLLFTETVAIGAPLVALFDLDADGYQILRTWLPPLAITALAAWTVVVRVLRLPLAKATHRRLRGEVLNAEMRAAAYRTIVRFPTYAFLLRVLFWTAGGLVLALRLHLKGNFPLASVGSVCVVVSSNAFGMSILRAIWSRRILDGVERALLPHLDPLRYFADTYRQRLVAGALATGELGVAGIAAFTYFFIPINLEQYLQLQTYFPPTVALLAIGWVAYFRRLPAPIDQYLCPALSTRSADRPSLHDPRALVAYRAAQAIPYKLAVAKGAVSLLAVVFLVAESLLLLAVDFENVALIGGEAMAVTLGAALYEALWHRATLRPFLNLVAARHRPSPDSVRTPLSIRAKMLTAFGLLALFSCGLSLFWSFMQFKTLATAFIQRESELRLESAIGQIRSDAQAHGLPRRQEIVNRLKTAAAEIAPPGSVRDQAVYYYLPPEPEARSVAMGGGQKGPPPLPWTGEALMRRLDRGQIELSDLQLTGAYARLYLNNHDLGAVAVLLPGYRGRGPSTKPQIRILVAFFVVLLVTSMGMVFLVSTDLTNPIRDLERRAGAMARGDLVRPVVSCAGEADEVGRLTFAIEDMRRALNDKLRSSTEINLSLEQEVTRRTAELERRNRELKEALEKLERTQDELVRSEKMASMGRLVAGIAHEINNPVNAVVNTVGPLEQVLGELTSSGASREAAMEVEEMIRVIQRGAARTKEIVQALHNYSRGDDDRLVEVDLQRGIDDSLDLLRHHLKNGISVERHYGEVGRVRGHAGQLHQVFMNLLTNAAQALDGRQRGGTIRIRTTREDGKVVISVADDGPGIPSELLPRIFDPFFTTKEVGKGSGLGLSIVHGIVERHGGSIGVESEVGRGTTFTVRLPVASA